MSVTHQDQNKNPTETRLKCPAEALHTLTPWGANVTPPSAWDIANAHSQLQYFIHKDRRKN